jgi:hypothetical protein
LYIYDYNPCWAPTYMIGKILLSDVILYLIPVHIIVRCIYTCTISRVIKVIQ